MDPLPPPAVWRWSRRAWVTQGLIAFVILAAWTLLREDGWHAELSFANYDCSQGEVCRFRPGLHVENRAGDGRRYRYGTNANGFRSPEFPPLVAAPGVYRVQVYGSSPMFGLGVDDGQTLPEALRLALLAALPGRQIEVMNFGLPMNYFSSELSTYRAFGRAYAPDLVVFVQPELERTIDMNARLLQIERSPTLRSLLANPLGRILVNRYQSVSMALSRKSEASGAVREKAQVLLSDQGSRGLQVCFFDLYDSTDDLADVMPVGLRYQSWVSGLSRSAYLGSDLAIARDGHPNALGQRHFAGLLAAHLVPLIAAPKPVP